MDQVVSYIPESSQDLSERSNNELFWMSVNGVKMERIRRESEKKRET